MSVGIGMAWERVVCWEGVVGCVRSCERRVCRVSLGAVERVGMGRERVVGCGVGVSGVGRERGIGIVCRVGGIMWGVVRKMRGVIGWGV